MDPPSAPTHHGHATMEFPEPENREGEAVIRQRRNTKGQAAESTAQPTGTGSSTPGWTPFQPSPYPQFPGWWMLPYPQFQGGQMPSQPSTAPSPSPQFQGGWTPSHPSTMPNPQFQGGSGWTPFQPSPHPPFSQPPPVAPPAVANPQDEATPRNRIREWRKQRALKEDQQRMERGEAPKKRIGKELYHYNCKTCGQPKTTATGHTQMKGKWYCPESGMTVEEWKRANTEWRTETNNVVLPFFTFFTFLLLITLLLFYYFFTTYLLLFTFYTFIVPCLTWLVGLKYQNKQKTTNSCGVKQHSHPLGGRSRCESWREWIFLFVRSVIWKNPLAL